jgi:hypothetical protein
MQIGDSLERALLRLETEVLEVYKAVVLPSWGTELHGFAETLHGYMMLVFSHLDLVSAHWKGSDKNQSQRMVAFLKHYVGSSHEASSVAIQIWRHKLVHTSQPRYLLDRGTGKHYRYLLHWWEHLPREQHFTFAETHDSKVLNLGLVYLVGDLQAGVRRYLVDLRSSTELQVNYHTFEAELQSYEFRRF